MSLDVLTSSGSERKGASNSFGSESVSAGESGRRSYAWLLPVGLLLGFVLVFVLLFWQRLVPGVEVNVARVAVVRSGDEANTSGQADSGKMLFQASGWIEPDPYITNIPSLNNGVVREVMVLEGDTVKKGQLIATMIDDEQKLALKVAEQRCKSMVKKIIAFRKELPILEARVEAVKMKVNAGRSLLEAEQDNLDRLEKIRKEAVSLQSVVRARFVVARHMALVLESEAELPELAAKMDQINAELEVMSADLGQLDAQREIAELAVDRTKIYAPMDGLVLHLHAAPGSKRILNMDDPRSSLIIEMYDPEKLQARIDVPLTEAAGLLVGQRVELVSDLLANKVFGGKVTRISGRADLQRNTLQAKVAIVDPDSRLRPEMLLRAKFYALAEAASGGSSGGGTGGRLSLYVAQEAVTDSGHIWVVSPEGRAEKRTVELGSERSSRDGHVLVLSGLNAGEQAILPPHSKLKDGLRVSVSND